MSHYKLNGGQACAGGDTLHSRDKAVFYEIFAAPG